MTVDRRGFVIRSGAGAAGLTIGLPGCGTGTGERARGVGAEDWPTDPDALEARYRDNIYTRLLGVRPRRGSARVRRGGGRPRRGLADVPGLTAEVVTNTAGYEDVELT